MMQEWWSRFIEIATLIAIAVTAWATSKTWGSQRRRDAASLPFVTLPYGRTDKRNGDRAITVKFDLPDKFRDVWEIKSVRVKWPFWKSIISEQGEWHQNNVGEIWFSPVEWKRSLMIGDHESHSGVLLLHPHSPSHVELIFTIALRVDATKSSRFATRINITD
jgi:hypothetical protein